MGLKRGVRRFVVAMCVAAVAIAMLFLLRAPLMQLVGNILVRDDTPREPAPFIVLLMGDGSHTRALKACDLYKAHLGRKIIFADEHSDGLAGEGFMTSLTQATEEYLQSCGVSPTDLIRLRSCDAGSTWNEAHCVRDFLLGRDIAERSKIILVTSWYHTSRAGWLFGQVLQPVGTIVEAVPATSADSLPSGWWRRKGDFLAVFNEYLKWAYWLAQEQRRAAD